MENSPPGIQTMPSGAGPGADVLLASVGPNAGFELGDSAPAPGLREGTSNAVPPARRIKPTIHDDPWKKEAGCGPAAGRWFFFMDESKKERGGAGPRHLQRLAD